MNDVTGPGTAAPPRPRSEPTGTGYRALFAVDGAPLVMVAGFVGRVPNAMRALACLLLASGDGYGYGMSASVAAAMSLSQAAGAPFLGRLSARVSQRAVILGGLAVHVAAGACLAALATEHVAVPWLFVLAALFGASVVPLGSLVRARWASLVDGALRMRAYSYEATVDELIYIVGPLIVTAISVGAFPASGIVVSLALALTGGCALARHVSTEPKRVTAERAPAWVLRLLGAKPTLLVCVGLGGWFGAMNVVMVAFASRHGDTAAAGRLLAVMTAASLVASIGFGAVSWQVPARTRMMLTVLVLSVCSVALLLPGSIAGMYVAAFVAGIAISPSLISVQHVLGELAPTGQISEAFALMGSSIAVGTAVATACSGVVVNDYGSRSGLLTVVAIAVATSIAGVAGWATLRGAAPPTPTD